VTLFTLQWYNITDEAEECYRAYELLSVLRKSTYLKYNKKDAEKEIERRIKIITGKNRFI
jgi:hypothetical protein